MAVFGWLVLAALVRAAGVADSCGLRTSSELYSARFVAPEGQYQAGEPKFFLRSHVTLSAYTAMTWYMAWPYMPTKYLEKGQKIKQKGRN